MNQFEGLCHATPDISIGIVVSRFNEFITGRLLQGAERFLTQAGFQDSQIDVAWTPGAFEIPSAALSMAQTGRYRAIVTLGCILKGDTDHYLHVANACSIGVEKAALDSGVPMALGVLTCSNLEEAIHRAGAKMGNKGAEAAQTALEMAHLIKQIQQGKHA